MTWLSRLHPYPAMIADSLATALASDHVTTDSIVLDPFCGTGRTLMAASAIGATGIGMDVNPLAVLITQAKASSVAPSELRDLLDCLPERRTPSRVLIHPCAEPER